MASLLTSQPRSRGDFTTPRSTLLQQLSTDAPVIEARHPANFSKSNTQGTDWIVPSKIARWKDFNYQTLKKSFETILHLEVQPLDFSQHFEDITEFTAEYSLEGFFNKWTRTIVSFSLKSAQNGSKLFEKQSFVRMVQGCDAKTKGLDDGLTVIQKQKNKKSLPDWAGILSSPAEEGQRPYNIVPGDTKLSYKWKSKEIVPGIIHEAESIPRWLWPIMQVFTYCHKSGSRYGYIITDKELVVLRVRAAEGPQSFESGKAIADHGSVEFAVVDYKSTTLEGSEPQLTINMALWWLHLLAAKERSIQQTYGPLDQEYLPTRRRAKANYLEESDTDVEHGSVNGTERSRTAPPIPSEISFQVSHGPGSSFGPFSETESGLEQPGPSSSQKSTKRAQTQSVKPSSSKSDARKSNKKRRTR